jgi:hypothetical protein
MGLEQRCQQTEVDKTCGNRHEPDGGDNPTGSTEQHANYYEYQTRANAPRSSCSCRHEPNERHVETSLSSPNQSSRYPYGYLVEDNHHRGVAIPRERKGLSALVEP